jgi:indolepyruvate ferredoxin oxidoreductase
VSVIAADPAIDKAFSKAVARNAFKLMAYKDEYEVARLFTDERFQRMLNDQFTGDFRLKLQMAPPIFSKCDPETGHLKKRDIGSWMFQAMRVLVKFKGLRGTALDIFGRTEERRMERALIEEYFETIERVLPNFADTDYAIAKALAELPEKIRGYGHVKKENAQKANLIRTDLLSRLTSQKPELDKVG